MKVDTQRLAQSQRLFVGQVESASIFVNVHGCPVDDHGFKEQKVDVAAPLHWRDEQRNLKSNSQRRDSCELRPSQLNQSVRVRTYLVGSRFVIVRRVLMGSLALITRGLCF